MLLRVLDIRLCLSACVCHTPVLTETAAQIKLGGGFANGFLSLFYPTLCIREIRVSQKIRVLHSQTSSQIPAIDKTLLFQRPHNALVSRNLVDSCTNIQNIPAEKNLQSTNGWFGFNGTFTQGRQYRALKLTISQLQKHKGQLTYIN